MPRLRTKRLSQEYGISGKRYKELCGFCEQYPEWKELLKKTDTAVKSPSLSGMPHGSGNGSAVEGIAINRILISDKINLIETTAKEASPDCWEFIIKSACYEIPFEYMRAVEGLPMSERSFYDVRRYFFYLLSQKR